MITSLPALLHPGRWPLGWAFGLLKGKMLGARASRGEASRGGAPLPSKAMRGFHRSSYSGSPTVLCGRSRVHLGHRCSTPTSPQTSRLVLLEVRSPGTVSGSSIPWELVRHTHPQVPPPLGEGLEDGPSSKPSRACDASSGVHPTAPGHLFVRQVTPGLQESTPEAPDARALSLNRSAFLQYPGAPRLGTRMGGGPCLPHSISISEACLGCGLDFSPELGGSQGPLSSSIAEGQGTLECKACTPHPGPDIPRSWTDNKS